MGDGPSWSKSETTEKKEEKQEEGGVNVVVRELTLVAMFEFVR